jgi:hypothetical protein
MIPENFNFYLRIYDNYHYQDESEAFNSGSFETGEEAYEKAKSIIDDYITSSIEQGIQLNGIYSQWMTFGEDPVIRSTGKCEYKQFSASDFLKEKIEVLK